MRRSCWLSANVRSELRAFFANVDSQFSLYYEDNPNLAEPQLDIRLSTLLETSPIDPYIRRINSVRTRRREPRLSIKINHITHTERKHGADIGIVARLDVPGENTRTKAVLVQGKRLHPDGRQFDQNCTYSELFRSKSVRGPQWKRMTEVTDSSIYFFYNPDRLLVVRTIKPVRTLVLTAQQVAGIAAMGEPDITVYDLLLNKSYPQGKSFSSWMVDDFICCNTGDEDKRVIITALGENPEFPVRHTVDVSIQSTEAQPNLF
jgi:hypothetical protein